MNPPGLHPVCHVGEIPGAVRQAFQLAGSGEPGPVGVVVPYNLLIEQARFSCPPLGPPGLPFDEAAFQQARSSFEKRLNEFEQSLDSVETPKH